jgi:hypothetical protein
MKVDPIEDAAHPTGTHGSPGSADKRGADDTSSDEEEIIDGRNPTQRKIEAERQLRIERGTAIEPAESSQGGRSDTPARR